MTLLETQIQRAFVEWLRWNETDKLIWYSIPNSPRNKVAGARLKAEGMRAGSPDMGFVLPNGEAAFIEFKTTEGRLSGDQRAFRKKCLAMGVRHAVCRSSQEAIDTLTVWMTETQGAA